MMNGVVRFLHGSRRIFCGVIFTLYLICSIGGHANANTLSVPLQYPTIQAAVNAAVTGDTVLVADGTYTGAGNQDIDFSGKDLIVQSANGPANCIIDCRQIGRAFYLHSNETVKSCIVGFTIKNGKASDVGGGGIYINTNSPAVKNCVLNGNTAMTFGGGIYGGTVTDCTFTGNSASFGGGLYQGAATHCVFTSNFASHGGGVFGGAAVNCLFNSNSAQFGGGTAYGTALNCAFGGNTAAQWIPALRQIASLPEIRRVMVAR